ncbi:DNA-3-methyladenine glycosylase-like [Cimex lectularius]|uniref:DNA-3-methyladenine glycosylase II n=1 Tax=Cimex lectularius TaxID=79782 RepID=A0A8I6RL54_CIMLE|nr:DNA-3-methyladenine glycosylase-like [Cimex lectularius]
MFSVVKNQIFNTQNISRLGTFNKRYSHLRYNFFNVPPKNLAKKLLGKVLVREEDDGGVLKGVIVETEAYLGPHDLAAHSSKGRVKKAYHTFLPPGICGFTPVYGIHIVFSISCLGDGTCVLIRALMPIAGIEKMIRNCLNSGKKLKNIKECRICSGPAKLCKAFNLTTDLNKTDISKGSDKLYFEDIAYYAESFDIVECPRIGLSHDKVGEWYGKYLRFYILGHPSVSKKCKKCEKALNLKYKQWILGNSYD